MKHGGWMKAKLGQEIAGMDPARFVARYFGFEPDAKQAAALKAVGSGEHARGLLLCCSRQWGKSTTAAALIAHRAMTRPGTLVVCVSPTLRQTGELLLKVRHFLSLAQVKTGGGKYSLQLANGARVMALPENEANVRGFSAPSLLVIDEAARVEDGLYEAMRPMQVVGRGNLVLLSTPFGERGFFWKEWTGGSEREWTRISVPATECPRISAEVLEQEKLRHSAEWFAQEYLCSFVGMENQAFRTEWLEEAERKGMRYQALQFEFKGRM